MDFIDHIRDLSIRIQKQKAGIQTEEATNLTLSYYGFFVDGS